MVQGRSCEVTDTHRFQRGESDLPILEGGRGKDLDMRRPAHHHDILHQKGERGGLALRDVGDALGRLSGLHAGKVLAVEQHPALPAA